MWSEIFRGEWVENARNEENVDIRFHPLTLKGFSKICLDLLPMLKGIMLMWSDYVFRRLD